ncbi:MAG: S-layer homology domain-containing protein [Bacillota bacterium]|nr:S-layer homology domain-containing protein [Bacillota bacterium]
MKRKCFSGLLALIMTMGLGFGVLSADIRFTDVNKNDWFYEDVEEAVEKGLVNGKSETLFAPHENLTSAEAVKLAAVMHQKYKTGSVTLKNGNPWYQSYVNYCRENKIIRQDYPWNHYISRAEYMDIFSRALPASELKKINEVPNGAIPDVSASHQLAEGIYKLYRAGIVNGVDAARNCKPDANITRAEVAAILTRMMDKDERVKFSMGAAPTPDSPKELKIVKQPADKAAKLGEQVRFKVVAEGEGMQYQWQRLERGSFRDLAPAPVFDGIQTSELTVKVEGGAEGATQLRCIVKDKHGKQVVSSIAKLMVQSDELKITQDLDETSLTVKPGDTAEFKIKAVGKKLKYNWSIIAPNGVNEAIVFEYGQGTDSVRIWVAKNASMETYKIRCEVTDENNRKVVTKDKPIFVESYIKDIVFFSSYDSSDLSRMRKIISLTHRVIEVDLNKATGGPYIYACVEQTGDINEAITDIFGKTYNPGDPLIEWGDMEHYGKSKFYKSQGNLNEGLDGAREVYLYKTYEQGGSRHPLIFLDAITPDSKLGVFNYGGYEVMKFQNSSENANLNEGANPGSYIYFIMKRK